jgi:hypothetical protein
MKMAGKSVPAGPTQAGKAEGNAEQKKDVPRQDATAEKASERSQYEAAHAAWERASVALESAQATYAMAEAKLTVARLKESTARQRLAKYPGYASATFVAGVVSVAATTDEPPK